eukprot:6200909-Pleurochrysis_carterae.AAC.1
MSAPRRLPACGTLLPGWTRTSRRCLARAQTASNTTTEPVSAVVSAQSAHNAKNVGLNQPVAHASVAGKQVRAKELAQLQKLAEKLNC